MHRKQSPHLPLLTLAAILLATLAPAPAAAGPPETLAAPETPCTVSQVTRSDGFDSYPGGFADDGRRLFLTSEADLTGGNGEHDRELFVYDRVDETFTQLTARPNHAVISPDPTADGSRVFFLSGPFTAPAAGPPPETALVSIDLHEGTETELLSGPIYAFDAAADGSTIALLAGFDPVGANPDGNGEIFRLDVASGTVEQLTETVEEGCSGFRGCPLNGLPHVSDDGTSVAFRSDFDLLGDFPSGGSWGGVYVHDRPTSTLDRLAVHTDPPLVVSGDATSLAFPSFEDLAGENPGGGTRLFVFDRLDTTVAQVPTNSLLVRQPAAFDRTGDRLLFAAAPAAGQGRDAFLFDRSSGTRIPVMTSLDVDDLPAALSSDGRLASLSSRANPNGTNPDGGFEVFVARCPSTATPAPPEGDWITTEAFPDFRFKVRISSAAGEPQPVRREATCIPETLCISGAVPGRSELFVRIVGPKPNGRLWPTLVRFSTSRVEIWIEQRSTETLRYYRLDGATPGSDRLPGQFDREGFVPPSS